MTPWDELDESQRESERIKSNGCGTGKYLVEDLAYFEDCVAHDYNYFVGGTSRDRYIYDLYFYGSMLKRAVANKDTYPKLRWAALRAWVYFKLVRMFGWKVFNYK